MVGQSDADRGPRSSGGPKTPRGEKIDFFSARRLSNGRKIADNHRQLPIHGYGKRRIENWPLKMFIRVCI